MTRHEEANPVREAVERSEEQVEDVDYQALYLAEKEQGEELLNRYTRLAADFDNFRKRTHRQNQELVARANENLVCELLPVLDNFALALNTIEDPSILKGMQMIYGQLLGVLEGAGLEAIEAVGCPFDPDIHEAVARVESPEHEENIILEETRRGYILGGKVLRPAMVKVNIKKEE